MPATSSKTIRSLEPEQSAKDREREREAEREEEEENGDAWSDETPFIIVKGVSRIPKSRLGLAADRIPQPRPAFPGARGCSGTLRSTLE